MINISEQAKLNFLSDSTQKNLVIKVCNPDDLELNELNYYKGSSSWSRNATVTLNQGNYHEIDYISNDVDLRGIYLLKYIRVSVYLKISNITSNPGTLTIRCTMQRQGGDFLYLDSTINVSDYTSDYVKLNFQKAECVVNNAPIIEIRRIELNNASNTPFSADISCKQIQVEMSNADETFLTEYSSYYSKNYNLSEFSSTSTITNDNIVKESFSLTESLCSQDNIKFGLCESAHCEFSVVGIDGNLNGKTIKPSIQIGSVTVDELRDINFFNDTSGFMTPTTTWNESKTVSSNTMWTSSWLINTKITDYKDYFNRAPYVGVALKFKITSLNNVVGTQPKYVRFGLIINNSDLSQDQWHTVSYFPIENVMSDFAQMSIRIPYHIGGTFGDIGRITRPYFVFCDDNKQSISNTTFDISFEIKDIMVYMQVEGGTTPVFDPDKCYVFYNTLDDYIGQFVDSIPLGVFKVTEVKLEHNQNLVKQNITAYDNLLRLENNAMNWYTQYMFAVTTDDYSGRLGVEYARQIYSSFFNYATEIGFDNRSNYTETLIATYPRSTISSNYMSTKRITWQAEVSLTPKDRYVTYCEIPIANVSPTKLYMVDCGNYYDWTDDYILSKSEVIDYGNHIDPLKRGIVTNGGVMIEAYKVDDSLIDSFLVNRRDYFMLPADTKYLKVYCPYSIDTYFSSSSIESLPILGSVSIYEVGNAPDLTNGASQLFYYNLSDRTISEVDTSITGRDVVRSLLELCGCFFRLSRDTGTPEFIYCTKSGLYPRNDLYPADDLYPRAGTDSILGNGRYMSVTQADYQVQDYGKVQIIVQAKSSDTKSVCQMEYSYDNGINTYLINDNIFYSNENFDREYDYAYGLLERMYGRVANMGYVPNVTQALGMPWIECGDRIGVLTYIGGFESFIFRRTLKGIQLLIDTFESEGDEYNEAVKEFGYEEFSM